ncbi:hypothetical protein BSKO_05837 [Bryopsis sp. KO-2023]|nr:hypothetical protein BSKO_05837 [Bryopsis sp. KO-2023]
MGGQENIVPKCLTWWGARKTSFPSVRPAPRPILVSETTLLEQLEDFEDGGGGLLTAKAPVAVSCYRIQIMMPKSEARLLAGKLKKARAKHFPEAMDVEENVAASKDSQEREEKSRRIA